MSRCENRLCPDCFRLLTGSAWLVLWSVCFVCAQKVWASKDRFDQDRLDFLIWDAGTGCRGQHPTDAYRIDGIHTYFRSQEQSEYDIVILTGANHRSKADKKESYPYSKPEQSHYFNIDWFASTDTTQVPVYDLPEVRKVLTRSFCGVELLFTRLKRNGYYILAAEFDGHDTEDEISNRVALLSLIYLRVKEIRNARDPSARIIILAQHLGRAAETVFMNSSDDLSLLVKYHWHSPNERHYHKPRAYNFVPHENAVASYMAQYNNVDLNTRVQTLSVFLEKGATGSSIYLARKKITALKPWYWINPMVETSLGYYLGWLCYQQSYFECEREVVGIAESGTEFRELSQFDPQYLRLKLTIDQDMTL